MSKHKTKAIIVLFMNESIEKCSWVDEPKNDEGNGEQ